MSQQQTNQMHRRHSNRPDTRFSHNSRPRLVDLIDMRHELVKLAALIDWEFFEREWAGFFPSGTGRPATPPRSIRRTTVIVNEQRKRVPQSVGQSRSIFGFGRWFQCGIPLLELGAQGAIQGSGSGLQHEVRAAF